MSDIAPSLPRSQASPVVPPQCALEWKMFDGGRLYLARSAAGYFEMMPGERVRYVRVHTGGMTCIDLGPCTQAAMSECIQICNEFHRKLQKAF